MTQLQVLRTGPQCEMEWEMVSGSSWVAEALVRPIGHFVDACKSGRQLSGRCQGVALRFVDDVHQDHL